jgi:hypothetical protein
MNLLGPSEWKEYLFRLGQNQLQVRVDRFGQTLREFRWNGYPYPLARGEVRVECYVVPPSHLTWTSPKGGSEDFGGTTHTRTTVQLDLHSHLRLTARSDGSFLVERQPGEPDLHDPYVEYTAILNDILQMNARLQKAPPCPAKSVTPPDPRFQETPRKLSL